MLLWRASLSATIIRSGAADSDNLEQRMYLAANRCARHEAVLLWRASLSATIIRGGAADSDNLEWRMYLFGEPVSTSPEYMREGGNMLRSFKRQSALLAALCFAAIMPAQAEDLLVTQYKADPSGAPYGIALGEGLLQEERHRHHRHHLGRGRRHVGAQRNGDRSRITATSRRRR